MLSITNVSFAMSLKCKKGLYLEVFSGADRMQHSTAVSRDPKDYFINHTNETGSTYEK